MRKFLAALGFLTMLPVPDRIYQDRRALSQSMAFFPVVGLLMGLALSGINEVLPAFLPERLVNLILITILTLLSGGLHLDGFADTVDAFSAKTDKKEEVLAIMRDSRIGAMGVIGLVLLLLLKYEALNSIPGSLKNAALVFMCVTSRWSQVFVSHFSKYAREGEGTGKYFIGHVKKIDFYMATAVTAVTALFIYNIKGILLLALIIGVTAVTMRYIRKRIGGMTGDTVGAVSEIIEAVTLLFIAFITRTGA